MTKKRNWKPATQLVHVGHAAFPARRDVGSDLPDAGLCLRDGRGRRGALQGRRAGLHLFALRQSDSRHVRAAHVRAGRCGGRARHGLGHGCRHGCGALQPQGRRSHRGGARAVRLLPLGNRDAGAEIRHRAQRWSTAPTSPIGKRRSGRKRRFSSSKARPTRRSKWSTSPRSPRSPTRSAHGWSSTMSSPRRCSRSRSSSARISSSIRRPSTLTARDGVSAASCSPTRSGSTRICTTISATPGRACRPSMPGRC